MNKEKDDQVNVSPNDFINSSEQLPLSQQQIYQKFIHLQTILLLAQLNSTYYQMNITLHRVFNKLENKYFQLKMNSFLKIQHIDHNIYQIIRKIQEEAATQKFLRSKIGQQAEHNTKSKVQQSIKKSKMLGKQQIQLKISLKSKLILSKIVKLLKNKQLNLLSFSFYNMIKSIQQNSTIKFNSSKSSKIQTIDSQKNKIFRRSNDKRINKKSFSVDKSKNQQRNFLQAPIKYQPYKNNSPILSADYSTNQYLFDDNSNLSSQINKYMQNANDMTTKQKKINLVNLYRNRSNTKSTSNQKYTPMLMLNQKEEAVKQLFYLKKKYKKLMAEFNWFSERFLKVIQEQNYVK